MASLHRSIPVSVLAVLKSLFVDVEDFDRVVRAGTSELQPGALVRLALAVSLSIFLFFLHDPTAVVTTCATNSRPPAKPLDRQTMALSGRECSEGRLLESSTALLTTQLNVPSRNSFYIQLSNNDELHTQDSTD